MKKIAVIMSNEDEKYIADACVDILNKFSVHSEIHLYSAEYTFDFAVTYAKKVKRSGFGAVIVIDNTGYHLSTMFGANAMIPVIAIPDTNLSSSMSSDVPMVSVSKNGYESATFFALQILAVTDRKLSKQLSDYRKKRKSELLQYDASI